MKIKAIIFDLGGVVILKDKKTSKGYQAINRPLTKFIRKISNQCRIYSLTNIDNNYNNLNKKRGLYRLFKKVYASNEMGIEKPDKKVFLTVLKDIALKPEQVLMVDDGPKHISVAKKLGMNTIIFKNNAQFFEEIQKYVR